MKIYSHVSPGQIDGDHEHEPFSHLTQENLHLRSNMALFKKVTLHFLHCSINKKPTSHI
jgi:hypothetical protein